MDTKIYLPQPSVILTVSQRYKHVFTIHQIQRKGQKGKRRSTTRPKDYRVTMGLKKQNSKLVIACPYFGCFILCLDYFISISTLRQVVQRPISTNPKLNFNQGFFIPLIQQPSWDNFHNFFYSIQDKKDKKNYTKIKNLFFNFQI